MVLQISMMYLFTESHQSSHTFVDEGELSLDLLTSSLGVESEK